MKDPKKMKNLGAERTLFLEKLSELATDFGCKGQITGEPNLPLAHGNLSLEQITRIQVMLGFPNRAALTLELGANPSDKHHSISLRQLNDAYALVHGNQAHQKMSDLLDQYGAEKNTRKNRLTKNYIIRFLRNGTGHFNFWSALAIRL